MRCQLNQAQLGYLGFTESYRIKLNLKCKDHSQTNSVNASALQPFLIIYGANVSSSDRDMDLVSLHVKTLISHNAKYPYFSGVVCILCF